MEKKREIISLNIYDEDDQIIKTVQACIVKIRFGTVRQLMKLVKIDSMDNAKDMLSLVSEVWDKIENILSKCFPDMTDEDWDGVDTFELITVVMKIISFSAKKLDEIPLDEEEEKN